jgi:hypothetical protein
MSLTKVSYSMIEGAPANVLDFGAVGDGATDDTAAIQEAIDYCLANAVSLYVPTGKYKLTSQIDIPVYSSSFERGLIIQGEGWGSQFIVDHAGVGFYVTCVPSFGTYQAEFRDLFFTTGTTSPDKIIHNVGGINTLIRDCKFRDATVGTGCVVNDNAYGLTLQGCVFWGVTGTGVFYAQVPDLSTYSYVNSIIDCEFSIVTTGVEMQGCNAFLVSNTVFQECNVGFYANPKSTEVTAFNISFETCWFERNTTWDIQLDSDLNYWCEATIRNCQFSGFVPTQQCHIQLEQKSRITIEGTPAGNTVIVSGALEAAAVLIRATNFIQSGTYAWTSIDPLGNIVATTYKSLSGTFASPTSGSAVTLTTLPSVAVGTWLVTAAVALEDATTGTAVALVTTQAGTSAVTSIKTASQIAISTSGLDLKATQTTGIVYSITWSLTRLS